MLFHAAFQASKQSQTHQLYHKSSQNNWHSSSSYTIDLYLMNGQNFKRLLHKSQKGTKESLSQKLTGLVSQSNYGNVASNNK